MSLATQLLIAFFIVVQLHINADIELMFTTPNVTVNEDIPSGTTMVCFIPNRASAMDYTVVLSSTQEGINPATRK